MHHFLEDFRVGYERLRVIRQKAKNPGAWLLIGMVPAGSVDGNAGVNEDQGNLLFISQGDGLKFIHALQDWRDSQSLRSVATVESKSGEASGPAVVSTTNLTHQVPLE